MELQEPQVHPSVSQCAWWHMPLNFWARRPRIAKPKRISMIWCGPKSVGELLMWRNFGLKMWLRNKPDPMNFQTYDAEVQNELRQTWTKIGQKLMQELIAGDSWSKLVRKLKVPKLKLGLKRLSSHLRYDPVSRCLTAVRCPCNASLICLGRSCAQEAKRQCCYSLLNRHSSKRWQLMMLLGKKSIEQYEMTDFGNKRPFIMRMLLTDHHACSSRDLFGLLPLEGYLEVLSFWWIQQPRQL